MALVPGASRQWTPTATVTCACASSRYVCTALEYRDCVVLQLWKNELGSADAMPGLVELSAHTDRVQLATFHETPTVHLLCTVSSDCVVVWRIVCGNGGSFDVHRLSLLESPRSEVTAVAFDASGTLIAVALAKQVEVLQVQTRAVFVTLEGHSAKITSCLFHPCQVHLLVTASEDRTFKIWDLSAQTLLFQSAVLSAYAILHVAVHPITGDIACAFGDGLLKVFDATKFGNELATVAQQLDKVLDATQNVVSSLPPWARSQRATESAQARALVKANATLDPVPVMLPGMEHLIEPMHETTCTVLALAYIASATSGDADAVQPFVDAAHLLLVPTVNYLLSVNAFSYDVRVVRAFQDDTDVSIGLAKHVMLRPAASTCDVWVLSAFVPRITYMRVSTGVLSAERPQANQEASLTVLSMFPLTQPPPTSVLLQSFGPPAPVKKASKLDQPITYRSSIPSSGYGAAKPKSLSLKFKGLAKGKKSMAVPKEPPRHLAEYPVDSAMPTAHLSTVPHRKVHEMGINQIDFAPDGQSVATAANDKLAQVFSLRKPGSHVFVGHDKAVRTVQWSHSNKLLLTSSADTTARVWVAGNDVASLVLPPPSTKVHKIDDVTSARFYFMDKFVALTVGNALKLILIDVDFAHALGCIKQAKKTSDLARLENHSKAKVVASYRFEAVQSLTSLASPNAFLSHLLVTTGSDKSVRIVDAAVGKTVRVMHGAHTRAAHSVVLPHASRFVNHPPNFYDLMLTGACDSTVHLWDIRADNCIMRFAEHLNRVHPVGLAFSPCMRYVATGSEDKVAYLYDVRMGRSVAKLHGHTDVVAAVAFNPLVPQLATASLDGTVRFYGESSRDE
ncbi:hypothetical protein ACHHYP_16266 [Achlya hypogyna]|uniref:WD repeat-containing protein 27-like n=1 Tax=Achlya hypogyna TaxID=1202772 RepID=A0A1V9Y9C6_ACHHY|nr:hypothetical protein ACHHYP_16266 [Achlya hypogyna]